MLNRFYWKFFFYSAIIGPLYSISAVYFAEILFDFHLFDKFLKS